MIALSVAVGLTPEMLPMVINACLARCSAPLDEHWKDAIEEDFRKRTLKNVISKYFNNSYLSAVSSLVKEEDISLEELKQLIQDVEKGRD